MKTKLAIILLMLTAATSNGGDIEKLLSAIRFVESSNLPMHKVSDGDGGKSIGPFQIGKMYWTDAKQPGSYQDVRKLGPARKTVLAYWARYAKAALKTGDFETLARIHNGGPRGASKTATVKYWKKVQKRLAKI